MSQSLIYDFNTHSKESDWVIVNDDVMGGLSSSQIRINEMGNGLFEGSVSTVNNGINIPAKKNSYFKIRLKGDSKEYQFRLKDYYSFFNKLSFQVEMYPYFRGTKLKMNNFNHDYIQQIIFLIGNNKNEKFKLPINFSNKFF